MRIPAMFRVVIVALIVLIGGGLNQARADNGSIVLTVYKAGWIIGGSGGHGTLTFRGKRYPLSVGGLDYLEGERCILVNPDPSTEAFDEGSSTRGSCSPAGFNAVVDLPAVDGYLSDEVRRQLGDITALRFELVGDEVHVFVARVPEETDRS